MERKRFPMNLFPAEGKRLLEALLLCSAEPLTLKALSDITEFESAEILDLLAAIQADYQQQNRGFALTEIAGGWMFATYPQHAPYIEKLVKPRLSSLSQAALEVLSIVAYRQPITRAEIEEIRGVSCDSSLGTLLDRGLIDEKGRKDAPGRPILFGTTTDFLKYFGLSSIKDLPAFSKTPDEEDAATQRIEEA
ncbi:MAG TPA: SMC-Scp complex subunit ScpB [Peptococcaceae bacterium]|nr:SMC-Scp complex subunit ScpB [Peptococcaceae bacterium]